MHTATPSTEPRYNDAEDLSPRAFEYFEDLLAPGATVSGGTAPPRDQHVEGPSTESRTASVVTLFPQFAASDPVPKEAKIAPSRYSGQLNPAAKKQSFLKKHYRRLKEIHDNGPPGEAQMVIAGIKGYLKDKKAAATASEKRTPRKEDESSPKPFSESAGQQQGTSQPLRQPPLIQGMVDRGKPLTRKDSAVSYGNISRTSREVPVKICRTVLEMDTNEPLPSFPPFDAMPKQRILNKKGTVMDINKPLPLTPLDCSSPTKKPSQEPPEESPVDAHWPLKHIKEADLKPSVHQPVTSQNDVKIHSQRAENEVQRTWLDDFTDTPNSHLPPAGKFGPTKAGTTHNALKTKISRPIPIPRTVDNCFPDLPPHSGALSEKAKGKQKVPSSPTWLDKLAHPTLPSLPAMPPIYKPKKRPDSDKSFICQGLGPLGEPNVYAHIILGHAALSAEKMRSAGETTDEGLIPEPLFSGRRSDGKGCDGSRAGLEKKTGRWV